MVTFRRWCLWIHGNNNFARDSGSEKHGYAVDAVGKAGDDNPPLVIHGAQCPRDALGSDDQTRKAQGIGAENRRAMSERSVQNVVKNIARHELTEQAKCGSTKQDPSGIH